MTHFAVAVISDGTKTDEQLLAPYQENNMDDCPKSFLKFTEIEEEYREKYETEGCTYVFMPDGRRLLPWDEEFRKPGEIGFGSNTHAVPGHLEQREIPYKETFSTFEDFMREWCNEEKDSKTGKYGYWENPNDKWDWYQLGGRYRGDLKASCGELGDPSWCNEDEAVPEGRFDKARIADIDFSRDDEQYQRSIEYWNSDSIWLNKEEWGNDAEYYANVMSTFGFRAVITPDGAWHEVGETGWFGIYHESNEEFVSWIMSFYDRFIAPLDPECTLAVYDCHI